MAKKQGTNRKIYCDFVDCNVKRNGSDIWNSEIDNIVSTIVVDLFQNMPSDGRMI